MPTVVWKFEAYLNDIVEIEMPIGSEVVMVGTQTHPDATGKLCFWARVDPEMPKKVRRFRFAGTGHQLGEDVGKHVGSFMMHGGALVWHIFEIK